MESVVKEAHPHHPPKCSVLVSLVDIVVALCLCRFLTFHLDSLFSNTKLRYDMPPTTAATTMELIGCDAQNECVGVRSLAEKWHRNGDSNLWRATATSPFGLLLILTQPPLPLHSLDDSHSLSVSPLKVKTFYFYPIRMITLCHRKCRVLLLLLWL